jgi:tetratricopeptide (TPR) repeat protein/transcriptional regulator with XRE-family HTH domain
MDADTPNRDLASLLGELRRAARLTQEELAERTGLGVRTIRQLESGSIRRPHGGTLDRLADGLDLDGATTRRLRSAGNRAAPERRATDPSGFALVPAQLPAAPTPFVGREADLSTLDAADGIVVVTGPPGVGKSSLVLHWAHRRHSAFPDGQIYLDLRGHLPDGALPAELAITRVLASLGLGGHHLPDDLYALAAVYRSALHGRRALLVLDNAGPATDLDALLPGSPSVTVVLTSRWRPDALAARHALTVAELDPLPPDDAYRLLGALVGAERLDADPRQAGELVRRCSGFPLALRLLAAPLATRRRLPLHHVAGTVAGPSGAGTGVVGDGMRAALDASYALLSPAAQRALGLLAVHPGPSFTTDHVIVLTGLPPAGAEAVVDELAAAHLVQEDAPEAYRFHDVIADYAARIGQDPEAFDRLFVFYAALASAARAAIEPTRAALDAAPLPETGVDLPRDRDAALRWLDADRANLEPVVRAARARRPDLAWVIARELATYAECRALWSEYLPIVEHGIAAAPDPLQAARLRLILGVTRFGLGQLGAGAVEIERAAAVFTEYGETHLIGRAMNNLGWARTRQGDHRGAIEAYRQALWIQARARDLTGVGRVLTNIGDAYVATGEMGQGLRYLRAALSVRRRHGTDRDVANALLNLGEWYAAAGRPAEAVPVLREGLQVADAGGDHEIVGLGRLSLGRALAAVSDVDGAVAELGVAAELRRRTGNAYAEALVLANLAAVYAAAGRPVEAEKVAKEARVLYAQIDDPAALAEIGSLIDQAAIPTGDVARVR